MRDEDKTKEQLIDELDDTRQRAAKLRRSREDLNAFTYTVAHDLKRPLSLILGFSDLLMEEYATISREELRKELQFVIQAGRKMNSVIDEMMLLVHVRDEEGLNITSLDMGDVVSEALERLAYIVERRQAEIVAPDRWPEILGYAPWLEEVWFAYISETLRPNVRPLRITLGATEQADGDMRF
ncbi:MAG: histidine kinase dimerization/phospho-acceptor domain-containing protein, partial [Chloroflexota bacterium]|nr:histidine kinase dimerization/phospho-acceptor domain-containing protein [Chloroflexota bacterium]